MDGNYAFTIFTYDDKNNKSVGVEVFGRAYGSTYESNLSNRVIEGVNADADSVSLHWFEEHSETLRGTERSEEHTSELQSLMRISYAVFCCNKKITFNITSI